MASYSKITRKMAGVIYGAIKRGDVKANDAFIEMLYGRADAHINNDVVWDDIEDYLKNAIDCIFAKDLIQAQAEINSAIRAHDVHFMERIGVVGEKTVVMQGQDHNGWDHEICHTMDEIKAYLRNPHIGNIYVKTNGKEFILPKGIGVRHTMQDVLLYD